MIKRWFLILWLVFVQFAQLLAQSQEPEMAHLLRSNGKIYVVVTVIAIVFCCILAYLIVLDRKISSVENKLKNIK